MNKNGNPQEILRLAEVKSKIWMGAQVTVKNQYDHHGSVYQDTEWTSLDNTRICYIDGAWKKEDQFTGQGWFCRSNGSADVMMGAMNLRKSLSPLYAECEALLWAMDCMKTLQFSDVVFATDCFQLVKMVSTPEDWPAFSTHMEETWKNLEAVSVSSLISGSDIFQEHKTPWRTDLHVVREVLLQLCFMSIQHHRLGSPNRLAQLLSLAVVVKKRHTLRHNFIILTLINEQLAYISSKHFIFYFYFVSFFIENLRFIRILT